MKDGRPDVEWLVGGGVLGDLVRATDWSATPLGPRGNWPAAMRSVVSLVLDSQFPMALLWGPELRLIYNDPYRAIAGERHPGALGRPASEVWPEIWHGNEARFAAVLQQGATLHAEDTRFPIVRHGDTVDAYFTFSLSPVRDQDGAIVGALVAMQETTTQFVHRKEAERALAENEQRLRALFENVALGVVEADEQNRFVNVNQRACAMLGYSRDELLGMSVLDLTAPEDRARSESLNAEIHAGSRDVLEYDKRYLKRDGTPLWVHVTISAVRDDLSRYHHAVGTIEDISERRAAEERIRDLNASLARRNAELDAERMRWQGVVEGIAEEVWICDARGMITLLNLPDRTTMGLEEFEDKSIEQVLAEVDIFHLDWTPRPPEDAPLLRSLRTGTIVRGEEIMRHRQRGLVRYRQYSCAPTRDANGTITGAVAIVRDVTDMKRAEAALREADRRKDDFIAMLSHELRNPLAPIVNSLYVLDRVPSDSEKALRARKVIARQVEHMTRIVGDLLDVSRITRGRMQLQCERLDLAESVVRTVDDHRAVFATANVDIRVARAADPLWVNADRTRLSQALGNLLLNAAKFTPAGGEVFVQATREENDAVLTVRDTGVGIPPEVMAHLFEPFTQADHTLDRAGGGLGLGLAVVRGIASLHGGTVSARSDGPGKGAEFTIRLPLASGAAAVC